MNNMKNFDKNILKSFLAFIIISFIIAIGISSREETEKKAGKIVAAKSESQNQGKTDSYSFRYVPNEAFGFGERLDYKVGYKFITAGYGYFQILPEPTYRNNRKCYDIRFSVESLKSLEFLYKVKDDYRTVLDVDGIFPWEFEQHVREGNYKKDFKAVFDQINNYALANDKKYKVTPYIHDIVSAFFFVRTYNLNSLPKDSLLYLRNFFDDTTWNLGVRVLGKETVEVDAGTFRCIIVEPLVVQGGLFKSEGRILIWLTDDERKIPVKVGTKIIIGFVGAELIKYSGIRGPIRAKIK
jgi:hypothetical protein